MTRPGTEGANLGEVIETLRRGWLLVAACSLVAGGIALGLSLNQTKLYTASASLLFRDPAFDQKLFGSTFLGSSPDPDRQAATNAALVGLRQVAERTAARGDIKLSADEVRAAVHVASDRESDVVSIEATDGSAALAARVANAFAAEFITFRREADQRTIFRAQQLVEDQIAASRQAGAPGRDRADSLRDRAEQLYVLGSLQTGNAELVQRAEPPDGPSSPRPKLNAAFGLFLGGLLGIALAFIRRRLDRRLRTLQSLEDVFERPVLARVPVAAGFKAGLPERRSRAEEAFSTLWTNLRYFNVTRRIDSVLVTSATSGDGKTTVAWNLSVAAARSGSRVLLVEADLRRPSLAPISRGTQVLGGGLTQVLAGVVSFDDVVVSVTASSAGATAADETQLDVLYAGSIPPNPAQMLDSAGMRSLLEDARQRYDLVVIDTPPITVVADAVPLLRQVNAVLVVARLGSTTRDAAAELSAQLNAIDAPVVGVVANYAPEDGAGYYYASGNGRPEAELSESTASN